MLISCVHNLSLSADKSCQEMHYPDVLKVVTHMLCMQAVKDSFDKHGIANVTHLFHVAFGGMEFRATLMPPLLSCLHGCRFCQVLHDMFRMMSKA